MMRNQVRAVVGVMVATAGVLLVPFAGASRADERMTGTDRMFVRKVAQTNIAEIETSRLALKRSRGTSWSTGSAAVRTRRARR